MPFAAYQALGQGVAIARGCANVLKLNCAFILVPVLRNFLSVLRGTWINNFLPIDKNIVFHKYIGAWIMVMVLAHTLAHYTNYNKVTRERASIPFLSQICPSWERCPLECRCRRRCRPLCRRTPTCSHSRLCR